MHLCDNLSCLVTAWCLAIALTIIFAAPVAIAADVATEYSVIIVSEFIRFDKDETDVDELRTSVK